MLLQIRNFAEEDAGVYMCTSTNSLGKIEGSIRLYQIGENIRDTALLYTCISTNSLGKIEGSIRLYQIGEINRDYNPTIHGKGESDQNHESVTLIYYPSMIA